MLIGRAHCYTKLKMYMSAANDYTLASKLDPVKRHGLQASAQCYASLGKYSIAIKQYDEYIRHNPTEPSAIENRANAYLAQYDLNAAVVDFRHLLEILAQQNPQNLKRMNEVEVKLKFYEEKMIREQKERKNISNAESKSPEEGKKTFKRPRDAFYQEPDHKTVNDNNNPNNNPDNDTHGNKRHQSMQSKRSE
jgi:tetratricopeptide (TPR) repeat protein